jgi:hypothetical protein
VTNQVMKSVSHSHLKNRAGRFWPRSTRLEERRLRVGPLDEGSRHPCLHCVPAPPSTPLVPCLLFLRVVEQLLYSNTWRIHEHRRSAASAAATPGGGQMGARPPSSRPLSVARWDHVVGHPMRGGTSVAITLPSSSEHMPALFWPTPKIPFPLRGNAEPH